MLTQSFADAVAEAEKIIAGAPHIQTEADLAEGYALRAGAERPGAGRHGGTALSDFALTGDQVDGRFAGHR